MGVKNRVWLYCIFGFLLGVVIASAFYSNLLLYITLSNKCPESVPMHTMPQTVALANASQRLVTVHVPIVAVNQYEGKGVVGNLTLRLIPGNSNVLIDTNPFVDTGLQYSANLAVTVAKLKTKNYAPNYDFILSYEVPAQVVGGESAGAATTIATIAALEGKRIKQGVLITGTINQDGSIGRVGGILEKAKAAAESGYKLFLVPKGQSTITYYERVIEPHSFGFGFVLYNNRYVPKTIDLAEVAKEEWGLEIKEVGTIEEALAYMVE